jgi:UDP-arabinose 4-epimerase
MPISPYGVSKLQCEDMIRKCAAERGLKFVNLRYFNAAGADPDGEIGEDHKRESRLIPLALDAASGRKPCINLFGTDYDTPDGTAIRDYVHVCDLASAHVAALHRLLDGGSGVAMNLGTASGHSVRSVLATVERITGLKVPLRITAARPGDPGVLIADAEAAQQMLRWRPLQSSLDVMVTDAWAWHRRRFGN